MEKQRKGTAPSSPPSNPLFPGTLPSTLPGTFGDLGFLRPVAGRWDSKTKGMTILGRQLFGGFGDDTLHDVPKSCSEGHQRVPEA